MTHIYFDNQASTPMDPTVRQAMEDAGYGNPHSSEHATGWEASAKTEAAREQVARLIGADPDEIFFTSGATEANNLAVLGIRKLRVSGKSDVYRSSVEHKSVLASCDALSEEYGFRVREIPVDTEGRISLAAVAEAASTTAALISVALVNNEIGTIQDIEAMSGLRGDALLHCDAAQAPEAVDMSIVAASCDMASLSAHKMRGPMGIGALYIARAVQPKISPIFFGGGQQSGIRPGTLPLGLCVGMGAAADLARRSSDDRRRVGEMRDFFLEKLTEAGVDYDLNGPQDRSRRHPGNANIRLMDVDASQLIAMLQPHLSVSTGSACTSGSMEPSYVLTAIGLTPEQAESSIRFSLGHQTTREQVVAAVGMLRAAIDRVI